MTLNQSLKIAVSQFTSIDPTFAAQDSTIRSIHQTMMDKHYRHMIIAKDNKAVGIVSQSDVFNAAPSLLAVEVMSKDVYRVNEDDNIDEVAFIMSDRKIGSAVVEDSEGNMVGIFTATDALNALVEIIRGDYEA
jgi:acetoin utilization protein AcuB